jgi:predicted Zn-ribbon and HTH transcriptional regulator
LKSSPEGEDLDGGFTSDNPHPSLPPQGKEASINDPRFFIQK